MSGAAQALTRRPTLRLRKHPDCAQVNCAAIPALQQNADRSRGDAMNDDEIRGYLAALNDVRQWSKVAANTPSLQRETREHHGMLAEYLEQLADRVGRGAGASSSVDR